MLICGKAPQSLGAEANRMPQMHVGRVLHNGHCVKWGIQFCSDSQQSSESPVPSEPGTESAGWAPLAACQYSTAPYSWTASVLIDLHSVSLSLPPPRIFTSHSTSPASFGVKVVQTSDEEAARGNNRQCQCCVLDLGSWITADFLPFPAIHCWGPSQCQGQSNYLLAASTAYLPFRDIWFQMKTGIQCMGTAKPCW